MYGADAFLGVINVVTRDPSRSRAGAVRAIAGRTTGAWGGILDAAVAAGGPGWGVLVGVAGEQADRSGLPLPGSSPAPRVPDYNLGATVARGLQRRSSTGYGRFAYSPDRARGLRSFNLSLHYSGLSRGGDFSRWSHLTAGVDGEGRRNDTRLSLQQLSAAMASEWRLSDRFDAVVSAGYAQGGSRDDERIEVNSDLFHARRNLWFRGTDAKAELLWNSVNKMGAVFGAELTYDQQDISNSTRVLKRDGSVLRGPAQPRHVLGNFGAYLQGHVRLLKDSLRLTGGARLDQNFFYGPQVTGRLAAVLLASDALVLKVLYGSAFKAPSPQLLFSRPLQPGGIVGNERLEPQFVHSWEVHGSYSFARYFNLASGLAYGLLIDKAELVSQGTNLTAKNIARLHAFSWESRLDVLIRDDLRAYLSLDLQRNYRDLGRDGYLAQIAGHQAGEYPRFIGRGGASRRLEVSERFSLLANLEARWVGPRRASDSNIFERGQSYQLPSYLDLSASLSVIELFLIKERDTQISVRGYDLLGRRSTDPGYGGVDYPRVGREIYLELRQEL